MGVLSEKILVMILCGGKGERLYPLTRHRSKPSVPFLGSYRIIDFSLSNCLNSGLTRIALLTQYKSLSLERHILNGWNIFHAESGSYILNLPAQGRVADHWYEGTADAVFQNIYTIQQEDPAVILILSADHIYRADYRKIIRFFEDKGADAVVLAKTVRKSEAGRFGVVGIDRHQNIVQFLEKPESPPPLPWDEKRSLISMGVYLFRTPVLVKALIRDARNPSSGHDFGRDIMPQLIRKARVQAYLYEGYWEDIGTIDAYWKANMAFLEAEPPFQTGDDSWPIRTFKAQYPPSFLHGADIRNSIIGSGCRIQSALVRNSIISPGVEISPDARIDGSILFEGARIGRGARLRRVIVDKFSQIPNRFEAGFRIKEDRARFMISAEGIRVIPKSWRVE
ncbi:MAG: glucose-1-phosphate adenylyltransferase [Candidatus Aminicenantes bacterium]|nr:glucose-1-phosphate adenylyltransferase [Candidatus Aminicenantes bacterium]